MEGALVLMAAQVFDLEDQQIIEILSTAKTIALLGASEKPERDSHKVMRLLIEKGYQVFPVNPLLAGEKILGREVFASIAELPSSIDMLDVFRHSNYLYHIVKEAKLANIKCIWTQLGVTDTKAELLASEVDITMIVNRCPAIEIPRLRL